MSESSRLRAQSIVLTYNSNLQRASPNIWESPDCRIVGSVSGTLRSKRPSGPQKCGPDVMLLSAAWSVGRERCNHVDLDQDVGQL